MDIESIITYMSSQNNHLVFMASWQIISAADGNVLEALLHHVPKFSRECVTPYSCHGIPALALETILTHNKLCRCFLYSKVHGVVVGNCSPKFSPEVEEELGNICIIHEEMKLDLYEIHFDVICSNCGKKYWVRQNNDRFYPLWSWKIV